MTNAQTFQHAFQHVQQSDDFNCAFACIAMSAGKTLDNLRVFGGKQRESAGKMSDQFRAEMIAKSPSIA